MPTISDDQQFEGWTSESVMVVVVATVSMYNALELLTMVASRFKGRPSLLTISLTVASTGILPYAAGFLVEFFHAIPFWAAMTISTVGWVCMVTGQSVVLYSRLGLILDNERILKAVKWMIIVDAILFHTSTTIIQYCKSYGSLQAPFGKVMFYVEKIQMTGFCLQEFIISGLYLWKTSELLGVMQRPGSRRVMIELIFINVVLVLGDIALLVLEYGGMRAMERTWKCFVYSVKLKLEFAILSKMVSLVQASQRSVSAALSDIDTFVQVDRTSVDVRRHEDAFKRRKSSATSPMPKWLSKLEKRNTKVSSSEHVEHVQIMKGASITLQSSSISAEGH